MIIKLSGLLQKVEPVGERRPRGRPRKWVRGESEDCTVSQLQFIFICLIPFLLQPQKIVQEKTEEQQVRNIESFNADRFGPFRMFGALNLWGYRRAASHLPLLSRHKYLEFDFFVLQSRHLEKVGRTRGVIPLRVWIDGANWAFI